MKAHTRTSAALIALLLNGAALRADPTITATPKQPCVELGADPPSASFKAACTPAPGSMPTDLCCSAEDQPVNWENFNFQWEWAGDPRVAGEWHSETADVDLSGITAPTTITANVKAKSQWRCVRAASPNPRAVDEPGNPSDSMNVKVDDLKVPDVTKSNGRVGLASKNVSDEPGERATSDTYWFYTGTFSQVKADEVFTKINGPQPEPCNAQADVPPPSHPPEGVEVGFSVWAVSVSYTPFPGSSSPFQGAKENDKRHYVQWFLRRIEPKSAHFSGSRQKKKMIAYPGVNGEPFFFWSPVGSPESLNTTISVTPYGETIDKHAESKTQFCCW